MTPPELPLPQARGGLWGPCDHQGCGGHPPGLWSLVTASRLPVLSRGFPLREPHNMWPVSVASWHQALRSVPQSWGSKLVLHGWVGAPRPGHLLPGGWAAPSSRIVGWGQGGQAGRQS